MEPSTGPPEEHEPGFTRAHALRERRLLERARGGDAACFERLYDSLAPQLIAYISVLLPDPDEAEIVFEEAMVAITRGEHEFDPSKGPILAWAAGIARAMVLDRGWRAHAGEPPAAPPVPRVDRAPARTGETEPSLLAFTGRLPRQEREVIVLRYALGLSLSQIAELKGCSEAVVRRLEVAGIEGLELGAPRRFARGSESSQHNRMRRLRRHSPVIAMRRQRLL